MLIESFRPGVMERLGLGPEILLGVNPRLVYVRVSGWGQTGPYRNRPGFGSLIEAMSGFAAKTGFADKPPIMPNMALADMVAGLQGAYAVMVTLKVAAETGLGQVVDVSLLEPLFATLGPDVAIARVTGRAPRASATAPRSRRRATSTPRRTAPGSPSRPRRRTCARGCSGRSAGPT